MRLAALTRLDRNAGRLKAIVSILAKYGLADWLSGLDYDWLQQWLVSSDGKKLGHLSREARIRIALTELGTTFVKLGQMLSTRSDLIGPALAAELAQLQANTPPDPPEVVRAVVAAELGKPPEELFLEFEDRALASASIGQVHRARLQNGQAVVVKLQHPGIEEKVTTDLDLLEGLAALAQEHAAQLRPYQPVALVREFRRTILRELDFVAERRSMQRFAASFTEDETIRVPAVYPALCTRRVLTMDLLEGVKGSDVNALKNSGADLSAFARRAATMYLQMIFRDGFYHADPHPGNYMLLPGGVVGVLDCGMVGRIDDDLREEIESLLLAVISRDAQELTDVITRICQAPSGLDRDMLRMEIGDFCSEYVSQSLQEFDFTGAINQLTEIIRRHRLVLPSSCALLLKTLVMLEGISRQLSPDFNLAELLQPYRAKIVQRRLSPSALVRKLQRAFRDWDRLLAELPRDMSDIIRRVRSGTFEVKHEHHRLEKAVNRLALGVVTAALLLAAAQLLSSSGAESFRWAFFLLGSLALSVAAILGYRLIRAISKDD
ncbi:MAG TPA: AarF/ABC1/UbiB kinase family protein [Gemmataceae bacterium]|nr:AarF/ABC1/UbiB kinase family protein [Gemmataceae bacterium]